MKNIKGTKFSWCVHGCFESFTCPYTKNELNLNLHGKVYARVTEQAPPKIAIIVVTFGTKIAIIQVTLVNKNVEM
jgi:hypothetical protein